MSVTYRGVYHEAILSEPVVKELSFDEKSDKIQRYLPKGLTEKILSQRNKIESERKQVTVMFYDTVGTNDFYLSPVPRLK